MSAIPGQTQRVRNLSVTRILSSSFVAADLIPQIMLYAPYQSNGVGDFLLLLPLSPSPNPLMDRTILWRDRQAVSCLFVPIRLLDYCIWTRRKAAFLRAPETYLYT